jgi:hypothetical protein
VPPPRGESSELGRAGTSDYEGGAGHQAVHSVDREPVLAAGRPGRIDRGAAGPPGRGVDRTDGHIALAGQAGNSVQRAQVADSGQEHFGAEQGEEPIGSRPPPASGLGQVLEASKRKEALTTEIYV